MNTWAEVQATAKRIGFDSYQGYLESAHWRDLRKAKGIHRCVSCPATKYLVCHHVHYRNLLDVTVQDLVVLCRDCHDDFHQACRHFKVDYIGIEAGQIIDAVADFRKTEWYAKWKDRRARRSSNRKAQRNAAPKGFSPKSYSKFLMRRFKLVTRKPTRENAEAFCNWLLDRIR